jgi:hypothetical protein
MAQSVLRPHLVMDELGAFTILMGLIMTLEISYVQL